jgi:uncharacterized protein DUF6152
MCFALHCLTPEIAPATIPSQFASNAGRVEIEAVPGVLGETPVRQTKALVIAVGTLLLAAVPVLAHHSVTAEFDPKKSFTVTGTLKRLDWTNPHIYVWVEVKEPDGNVVTYGIEAVPPGMLHRAGVTRDAFKVGETVTVIAAPAKDGTKNIGLGRRITFADGHSIRLNDRSDDDNN